MARPVYAILLVLMSTLLFCQNPSPQSKVATITAVKRHQEAKGGEGAAAQYDVSLKVDDIQYVVLYTPPVGANGVEYSVGMDLIVLVGRNSITITKFGRTTEAPTVIWTLSIMLVANPGASTRTRYSPGGSRATRKLPSRSESAVLVNPLCGLVTVTFALRTLDPEGSVTVPVRSPELICA